MDFKDNIKNNIKMKRTIKLSLVALLMAFSIAPSNAQLNDKITDGYRFVNPPDKNVRDFTDKVVIYTSFFGSTLTIEQDHGIDTIRWELSFTFTQSKERANIKKGFNLLLKLSNDEVIKLRSSTDNIYTFEVVTIGGNPVTNYTVSGLYPISQEDLEKVIKYGVLKLKAETSLSPFEKSWKKDKVGSYYGEYYEEIKAKLAERKSFDDDF